MMMDSVLRCDQVIVLARFLMLQLGHAVAFLRHFCDTLILRKTHDLRLSWFLFWIMSKKNVKKKLDRLFREPSITDAGSFTPRDLDRAPREFDEDGRVVLDEDSEPSREVSQVVHAAPWAARVAFESWARQRHPTSSDTKTPAVSPAHHAADVPMTYAVPPAHQRGDIAHQQVLGDNKRHTPTGMRAATHFSAWKKARQHDEKLPVVPAHTSHSTDEHVADAPPLRDTPDSDAVHAGAPVDDRTRRLAMRHYAHVQHEQANMHAQTNPLTQVETSVPRKGSRPKSSSSPSLPMLQSPAERLMWLSAHQGELEAAHVVESLRALSGTGLRTSHEARRLRMLAECLMGLSQWEETLETLRALHHHLTHDAWTLLQLAKICSKDARDHEEGLAWCKEIRRLHPWLSSEVDVLEAHIRRLQPHD